MVYIKWIANFQDGSFMDSEHEGPQFYKDISAIARFKRKIEKVPCTAIRIQMDGKTITFSISPKAKFRTDADYLDMNRHISALINSFAHDYFVVVMRKDAVTRKTYIDTRTGDMWVG